MDHERLRQLMKVKNISQKQACQDLGISQQRLSSYMLGKREPDDEIKKQIAQYLDTTIDFLTGNDVDITPPSKGVKIPVLGKVQAGIPTEAIENIIDYEEIPEEQARTGEFFGLQITGDSMAPQILEGDIVIVRKQSVVDNGDTAIILINGNEATVKKFYKKANGITLMPANPQYDPLIFSEEEVMELPVVVIGKVVELRRKF